MSGSPGTVPTSDTSEDFLVSGYLYKRRGGYGRYVPNPWQHRFFTITKAGVCKYYAEEDLQKDVDFFKNTPRGSMDLRAVRYEFIKDSVFDNSPTPYAMQIIAENSDEKWKLCADDKHSMVKWSLVFEKFATEDLVDTANGPSQPIYHSDDDDAVENIKKETKASVILKRPKTGKALKLQTKEGLSGSAFTEFITSIIIMNCCFYWASTSTDHFSWVYIMLANFVIAITLHNREKRYKVKVLELNSLKQDLENKELENSSPKSIKFTGEQSSNLPVAGCTFTQVQTEPIKSPAHTWCKVDYHIFHVRMGPDYNRNKKKVPSGPPLYNPVAVDVFCTNQRLDHAAQRFKLPNTSHIVTNHPNVPALFVVQIQLPSEAPTSYFTNAQDGPGWAILMYFQITEDTCNQLRNLATASPAVKLFAQWCTNAPKDTSKDGKERGRFKVICNCLNLDEVGINGVVGAMVTANNAKPILIRRTGTIFKGSNYMEKDIHVHKFDFGAKSAIHYISSKCGEMLMQIGFVIEGRSNDEWPECLFGCVAVNKPQEEQAQYLFE